MHHRGHPGSSRSLLGLGARMMPAPTGNTWIALFRGINVGGNHILPMAELRERMTALGLADVKTYIQSGNLVFRDAIDDGPTLSKRIRDAVEEGYGFRPHVLVLEAKEFTSILAANPYPEAVVDPKTLHVHFLAEPAHAVDPETIEELRAATERCTLTDRAFFLHAPDGIGRSKLAGRIDRLLGVVATGRNWRTVQKIQALVEE